MEPAEVAAACITRQFNRGGQRPSASWLTSGTQKNHRQRLSVTRMLSCWGLSSLLYRAPLTQVSAVNTCRSQQLLQCT